MGSQLGILFMRLLAPLPLSWVRGLGWLLGWLLYAVVGSRRRVLQVNLRLCFPEWSPEQRAALGPKVFIRFAQAWLDRGWLWHGNPETIRKRVTLIGALEQLEGKAPVVAFAPHFVGMDAGWMALTQRLPRDFLTIYTDQANKVVDAWIIAGRNRFGGGRLFGRADGVKTIVSALRAGGVLCLMPDMDFGPNESIFVPFYGVPAATVPSLPRFARLGRAKVLTILTRLTPQGYEVEVLPAWTNYPTDDIEADTALMNRRLQEYMAAMPEQYFWVHKRFKTRPPGQPSLY
jgi:KDO2-lipid IV(A) lauroyltransferase